MARVGADGGKYPPTEFSTKYAAVLAPKGKLVSPKDVFGEEGCFDKGWRTDSPRHVHELMAEALLSFVQKLQNHSSSKCTSRVKVKVFYECGV